MTSSTPSSEHGIAGRAVTLALALVLAHSLLAAADLLPRARGLTQEQANIVRLETWLHDGSASGDTLLVGSSLAYNIPVQRLAPNVFNLGQAGGSARTGLAAVLASGKTPRVILVEVSEHLARGIEETVLAEVTGSPKATLRRWLPALQVSFQPFNLVAHLLKGAAAGSTASGIDPSLRERNVLRRIEENSSLPDSEEAWTLRLEAQQLLAQARELESRGTVVRFVSIPVDARLAASPRQREVASLLKEALPHADPRWLHLDARRSWETSDGVHLLPEDAELLARSLLEALEIPAVAHRPGAPRT